MICRFRPACLASFLFAASLSAQVPANLPPFSTFLKANSSILRVATDAQGYIYVFGETSINPTTQYPQNVFVARLDPAAAHMTYLVELGGSSITRGGGLAVDAAGNAYVTGFTEASDFPTVPSTPNPANPDTDLSFVAKVNANGAIVYSSLFSQGVSAYPAAIAVDSNGNAIVAGTTNTQFPATPGAYNNPWNGNTPFITKIDATGTKLIFSAIGVGGSRLALDASNNIFIAGTTSAPVGPSSQFYPTTPGAFQTTYTPITICAALGFCMLPVAAGQQYVTKLSADGSTLLYSTFVTGFLGSYNAGMALDAAGDVWLTGDTASPDYPYSQSQSLTSPSDLFTTELDPTGSKVLLSVPQGVPPGSGNNLAFDPQGNLIEVGNFPIPADNDTYPPNVLPAPAPPPTGNTPSPCLTGGGGYILRISSQDGSVLGTQILAGARPAGSAVDSQGNIYAVGSTGLPNIPLTQGVVYDQAVTQRTVPGGFLERTSFSLPASPIGCVTDSPTMAFMGPVAPGQLITIFGNGIGPVQPVIGLTAGASTVPTSLGGVTVTFNGQAAPILYASSTQINVQAPFEIYQNPYTVAENTLMQLSYNGSVLGTRTFAVTPQNPSLFVGSTVTDLVCGNSQGGNFLVALALNQDGSINSCANPAPSGSQFTLFVNGVGTSSHGATGLLTANPQSINSAVALYGGNSLEVDAFTDQPGALSGVGQITARVPETILSLGPMPVTLAMNGAWAGPLTPAATDGLTGNAVAIPVVVFVTPAVRP